MFNLLFFLGMIISTLSPETLRAHPVFSPLIAPTLAGRGCLPLTIRWALHQHSWHQQSPPKD